MNKDVVVIGGGFAGLRAAVTLADAGIKVTVLESRSTLGGRARSFVDPATGETVDNGQHLFLSGYDATLRFLDRLGMRDKVVFQDRLRVVFVEAGGRKSFFDCPPVPSPWHFLLGIARLSSLSISEKWKFQNVANALNSSSRNGAAHDLDQITVEEWLIQLGQSARSREIFWDPLTIATLNEAPSKASATGLAKVLRTMLHGSHQDARLGMATVGLTDLYASAAQRIIEEKGGRILCNSSVSGLQVNSSGKVEIVVANGSRFSPEAIVSAVPPNVLLRFLPPSVVASDSVFSQLTKFNTSPIISINLWLDQSITEELFIGLIGTRVQWLFNKPAILAKAGIEAQYISLIMSAASSFIEETNDKLVSMAMEDLKLCFPEAQKARLIRSQVVRERDATVSLTVRMESYRPEPRTSLPNLFLAGDWTKTGLPATIESAVVSGETAARAVLIEEVI